MIIVLGVMTLASWTPSSGPWCFGFVRNEGRIRGHSFHWFFLFDFILKGWPPIPWPVLNDYFYGSYVNPKKHTAKLDNGQHNIQEIHQDFKQETETIDCFQINQQWKTKNTLRSLSILETNITGTANDEVDSETAPQNTCLSFPLKLDTCLWQVVSMAPGDLTTTKLWAGTLQRVASGSLLL